MGTEMEKKLKELCENITKEMGSCLPKMLRGKPHTEILRYAGESGIDLIVMGSHGLSGLEHVLFGSTADRVMREMRLQHPDHQETGLTVITPFRLPDKTGAKIVHHKTPSPQGGGVLPFMAPSPGGRIDCS